MNPWQRAFTKKNFLFPLVMVFERLQNLYDFPIDIPIPSKIEREKVAFFFKLKVVCVPIKFRDFAFYQDWKRKYQTKEQIMLKMYCILELSESLIKINSLFNKWCFLRKLKQVCVIDITNLPLQTLEFLVYSSVTFFSTFR